ncbi:MAG: sugar phosphate isomerase/epimerase, partial [Phycisphaerales bacterium]|nr:sugar phosphate isomerase/epimerase [Phycisphaerales bacterium]
MKLSITYLYTIFKYGYPPRPEDDFKALADIEKMGFRYLEMEGLGAGHTEGVWEKRAELKRALADHHIHVHNFCGVDPDLVSLDDGKRRKAYEAFKRTAELGAFFGAETLHLASYAPPVEYVGERPYGLGKAYKFGDVFRTRIPAGFSWKRLWDVLVESCRETAKIAASHGRVIIMEPRVGEVICSVDAMIRLIQDVGADNFKANFDTGHFSAQRENVVLALVKLEGMFANIHISDNNPMNTDHLPIGQGAETGGGGPTDWGGFFGGLRGGGYDGHLGRGWGILP